MDLAYILERGGYRHPFPPLEALYPATLLATCPSPLWLKTSEAYQATHTLFYLGDFGLDPARLAAHPDAPRLRSFVAHLLGVHVRQRDWDLVAELLLDCRCLGHAPEPLASLAWQALHDAWEAHGLVPGPSFDPALRGTLGPAEWERYCFDENYHTVLVTLLACAVWSRPVPPIAPGPARTPPTLDEDRIRSALAAAAGWLSAQAGAPGLAADDRAHAALGLASAVAAGADPAAEAALRSLLPALTFEALLGCDPLAVALLNPLLAAASVPAPAVAQAAAVVLEVCRQAPGPPGARQFLLAAAGLLEIPQAPMAWSQPLSSLFAGRDTVLLAAARLQALGPRSAAALAASPLAQAVLESALHEAFMRYDLEAGLALLLPLGQAAPRGEAVAVALDFLLAQQHPAGYVGFQDAGTGPGAAALRVQQKVRTTAWAAWTLRGLLHPAKRPA
jgi:hypothetical protein